MRHGQISPRKAGIFIDTVHILSALVIAVMAVFAIGDPEHYNRLFPLIFLFASLINLASAWYEFRIYPRPRKKTLSAWVYLISGLLILALFLASAVALWG